MSHILFLFPHALLPYPPFFPPAVSPPGSDRKHLLVCVSQGGNGVREEESRGQVSLAHQRAVPNAIRITLSHILSHFPLHFSLPLSFSLWLFSPPSLLVQRWDQLYRTLLGQNKVSITGNSRSPMPTSQSRRYASLAEMYVRGYAILPVTSKE